VFQIEYNGACADDGDIGRVVGIADQAVDLDTTFSEQFGGQ
jgi:hypothetical protein